MIDKKLFSVNSILNNFRLFGHDKMIQHSMYTDGMMYSNRKTNKHEASEANCVIVFDSTVQNGTGKTATGCTVAALN